MKNLYEILGKLDILSTASKHDASHFTKLGKLFVTKDYAALAQHISKYCQISGMKTDYQKMLVDLLPHFHADSREDAENRLFQLLSVLMQPNIAHDQLQLALETGAALVVNDVYEGKNILPVNQITSPLMAAMAAGDENVIRLLLKYGATLDNVKDMNLKLNADGETALHVACRLNIPELIVMVLSKNPDMNIKNKKGETPLHVSVFSCSEDTQLLLLNKGADPDLHVDSEGKKVKAFMVAYHQKNMRAMKLMIEKGYRVQNYILRHAKEHNPDIYKILSAPYKEHKEKIISSGHAQLFSKEQNDLSPLYRVLFSEDKQLAAGLVKRLNKIYYYPNSILKPLLDIAILASEGGHASGRLSGKKLKMLVTADSHLKKIIPGKANMRGLYQGSNTVYASGFNGNKHYALAVLLHELKHFADNEVYGNMDQPFRDSQKNHFSQVKQKLMDNSLRFLKENTGSASTDDIIIYQSIRSIFTAYKTEDQDSEVLVKVPEIIGYLGMEKGMAWLVKNEPALLAFYQHKFNPARTAYLERQREHIHHVKNTDPPVNL